MKIKIRPWTEWRLVDRHGRPTCDTFPSRAEANRARYQDNHSMRDMAPHRIIRVGVVPGKQPVRGRWIRGTWEGR